MARIIDIIGNWHKGKIYLIGGAKVFPVPVEEYTPEGWPFAVSSHGKLTTTWGAVKIRNISSDICVWQLITADVVFIITHNQGANP